MSRYIIGLYSHTGTQNSPKRRKGKPVKGGAVMAKICPSICMVLVQCREHKKAGFKRFTAN